MILLRKKLVKMTGFVSVTEREKRPAKMLAAEGGAGDKSF